MYRTSQPVKASIFLRDLKEIFRPIWLSILLVWALIWISRIALAIWQWERIVQSGKIEHLLIEALRFDGVLFGFFWILPAAITPWMALNARSHALWRRFLWGYGFVAFLFVALMEMCTPSFLMQYDSRPNFLFVEYLKNVKEVGGTLLAAYPQQLLLTALALPALSWMYVQLARRTGGTKLGTMPWNALPALLLSMVLFFGFALMGRGTLGHRAANPTLAAITADHRVNEWPLPSAYSVMFAVYKNLRNEDGGASYGNLQQERVIAVVRQGMGLPEASFTDSKRPTFRRHDPARASRARMLSEMVGAKNQPLNLVIILEESLGAEFVGKLGGLPLTPNLDKLSEEGIWFDQMYATGTRSIRGIEAVIAGFPPTSTQAVVKQPKTQRNLTTIASLLRAQNYSTQFFYGGESHFDNMRGFFLGNGFERIVDQKDMPDAKFVATWGASDGDVFDAAHQFFIQSNAKKPSFSLIFTSSNHSPFEFPDKTIELYEQPKSTVNNAVKYADFALGEFISKAKKSAYWDNTLFLIVADHNSRVYGDNYFPVDRFHIPALILGGPVKKPQIISSLSSQLDLIPTLISLMGLDVSSPLIGRDLLDPDFPQPGRAIMQFDQLQAYREGSEMVLLQPEAMPKTLRLDGKKWQLAPTNQALVEKAIAHALYAKWAYSKSWQAQ